MKKIAITLFLVLGSLTIQAQELTWQTDMNKALEISKKSQKPLFLFFTGSDWCGWCIRLQKEVFKTPEFAKWAKDNVILVELDFPRSTPQQPEIKKQNAELQQTFAVQGYPTVWFVKGSKKDGKINLEKLGSTGYVAGGPTAWLAVADKILANKPTKTAYTTN
jgi:protein disulfide-isomerase